MNKVINVAWKWFLILVAVFALLLAGYGFSKRDELITSNFTMKYFEEVVNDFNEEDAKEFVANSNNDVLYNNFVSTLDNNYFYEGVSDFSFKIKDKELFGSGEYQCYFANAFENYTPKCDLNNEGRYINYLVDIEVSYKLNGQDVNQNEKGLVVFVKDMEKGNYFTWKLVRLDRYRVID